MAVMACVSVLVVIDLLTRSGDVTSARTAVLSLAAALLVAFGSIYGGALVYDYGFNLETSGDHRVWHQSEQDVVPDDE